MPSLLLMYRIVVRCLEAVLRHAGSQYIMKCISQLEVLGDVGMGSCSDSPSTLPAS